METAYLSPKTKLSGNIQAAMAEMLKDIVENRGGGYASDHEAWAELKEYLENLKQMHSDIEKVHKEMWSAVKDHNADAFCALAQEFSRSATVLATDWTVSAALAKIAVELTDK